MKMKIVTICLVMAMVLAGCGGNDTKVIEGEVQAVTAEKGTVDNVSDDAKQEQESEKETVSMPIFAMMW